MGPSDWPEAQLPSSVAITADVVREHFRVAGHTPADNPTAGVGTPVALNGVTVLRYRQNLPAALPAHAVVVALPGFLAGAASFESLAVAVVEAAAGQA